MLSIVTITRNDVKGLQRTLDSTRAIRHEYKSIEQLVIDGSDDESAARNLEYCQDQLKVIYVRRDPRGISDAFNAGITQAQYSWLWFLNGGDQLHPALDLQFFAGFIRYVAADILIFQLELMQKRTIVKFPPVHKAFPPASPWIPHPATLVSKELFIRHGVFNENYKIAMDYEWWLRVYGKNVVVNMVSVPLTLFDENGLSNTQVALVNREGKEILKSYRSRLFSLWLGAGRNLVKQYRFFKKATHGN